MAVIFHSIIFLLYLIQLNLFLIIPNFWPVIHTHTHTHTHTRTHTRVYVCLFVCVFVYLFYYKLLWS